VVQNQGFNVAFSYYPLYYSVQLALSIDLEEVSPLRRCAQRTRFFPSIELSKMDRAEQEVNVQERFQG